MLNTKRAYNGMVVAPHHLASQAGLSVLRDGGNAVEAMVAAAAAIAVVYPHMNNLGGDNFWLIRTPDGKVHGIDACGAAAAQASPDWYREQGVAQIPERGPLAALTMAGAVSGWQNALDLSKQQLAGKLPLTRLLEDAIGYAREGVAVTATLADNAAGKASQMSGLDGFHQRYFPNGQALAEGDRLLQPAVAASLEQLAKAGLADFYSGDLARSMAADLESVGSPIRLQDFETHKAINPQPLSLPLRGHTLYNMPPPTQGLASLLLLGIYDRLDVKKAESFEYVHALVEAAKGAFRIRDSHVTDPLYMSAKCEDFLQESALDKLAAAVDSQVAAPWPDASVGGDTVWLGAIDSDGVAVSFIQSVYWEFGSGVVLPQSGVTWQNRGTSFSLDESHHNSLLPGRRPFHTIQPALAVLADGRVMPYGTMGGEGQPQTQAMVFSRYALHDMPLQESITAPRWLLGRTWGSTATNLRIESRFESSVYEKLKAAGHDVEMVGEFEEFMGHAGALVKHENGLIEAAADPRSDGSVAGY